MIETITFDSETYPAFQASGFAARFAFPFAAEVCKGVGYDIGCNRAAWSFPGAIPIDPMINTKYSATELPDDVEVDYIFSSHCLEHLDRWVDVLDHWHRKLKPGGVLFLYLPDFSQKYWRGWNNRKHVNMLTPEIVRAYFADQPDMWEKIFCSGVDLNNSFMVVAEKVDTIENPIKA